MKIKYTGLEPITNRFGDWKNGTVRNIPDGIKMAGFETVVEEETTVPHKRQMHEVFDDKMERDNLDFRAEKKWRHKK